METIGIVILFYGDYMANLIWVLSGNLIYHVFSMKTPDNIQTNFTITSPYKISLSALPPFSILTILVIRFTMPST